MRAIIVSVTAIFIIVLAACASQGAARPGAIDTPSAVGAVAATPTARPVPLSRSARPNATPGGPPPAGAWSRMDMAKLSEIKRDVVYCMVNNVALKMDMYLPHGKGDGPLPAAVYIHGGGWTGGDKASGEGMSDAVELLGRGYVVASVNYRLAPQYKFPAQIEDVKCAVRHLRANAAVYHLDAHRIGVWGTSAGGHLAALLGTTAAKDGFEGSGGYSDQSSRVQAVVDMFGPADLKREFEGANQRIVQEVFGAASNDDPLVINASPVTYVSNDDPPFLILHGEQDRLVPPAQSRELYERLTAAGVNATLVIVINAGHSFVPIGGPISPTRAEISKMVADFFDKTIR